MAPYMNSSVLNEQLDFSFQMDKADKIKRKWERVMENKEKLSIHHQMSIKLKLDKETKLDKTKKKKHDELIEDIKAMKEFKHQKFSNVLKKRD
jgi:hypothetical protein